MSKKTNTKKLFVIDTSVLMHDYHSLFQFKEHDIYIARQVIRDLDKFKKGLEEPAHNAREASRLIKWITGDLSALDKDGIPLELPSEKTATGRMIIQKDHISNRFSKSPYQQENDDIILSIVTHLQENDYHNRDVIFVTKDTNAYLMALSLGIHVEDYKGDGTTRSLDDSNIVRTGFHVLPDDFWDNHELLDEHEDGQVKNRDFMVKGSFCTMFRPHEFVISRHNHIDKQTSVVNVQGDVAHLRTVTDYSAKKNAIWGIHPKNDEQNLAMNLLMDQCIDLVMLLGRAGSGKTLLALAAALEQVIMQNLYTNVIFTRATILTGEDIGFLPGTEEEKLLPWMGGLLNNLRYLLHEKPVMIRNHSGKGEIPMSREDLLRKYIHVKDISRMRGDTFWRELVIIDEAQNLTPKQLKTIITRAGEGGKIILLGNLSQIDTPYLTETSSGLTHVVNQFQSWPYSGSIVLQKCVRSRLADYAEKML
ncbi:MAG: PhoH family protein [Candidatus Moraniibacteriota bacterium]